MTKLLYFSATWCGPCKAMKPVIAELESAGLSVDRIDIEESPLVAETFKVMSIPTFVVLKDDKETARASGAMPKAKLEALLAA
jgi:thioredoxin 1